MSPPIVSADYEVILADSEALAREVPIEPGSVRSRRLSANASVVGVGMDAGAVMREHVAQVPILIHVVEGHVTLDVEGARLDLPAGALVHVDGGVQHGVEAIEPTRFLIVLFHGRGPHRVTTLGDAA